MLRKYTKREIRDYIRNGFATDITELSFSELKEWRNGRNLEQIGYASGINGISAGIIKDRNTGEFFTITERTTALFSIF